jgi:hypothetical protein
MALPSPKERFQKMPAAKDWANMSVSPAFTVASDFAMLHTVENLTSNSNEQVSALANHFRLEGARMFLRTLTNLCDAAEPHRPSLTGGQLDHRA